MGLYGHTSEQGELVRATGCLGQPEAVPPYQTRLGGQGRPQSAGRAVAPSQGPSTTIPLSLLLCTGSLVALCTGGHNGRRTRRKTDTAEDRHSGRQTQGKSDTGEDRHSPEFRRTETLPLPPPPADPDRFILPDYPSTAKSLSPEHRVLCQLRLEEDIGIPDSEDVGIKQGMVMAFKDSVPHPHQHFCSTMVALLCHDPLHQVPKPTPQANRHISDAHTCCLLRNETFIL